MIIQSPAHRSCNCRYRVKDQIIPEQAIIRTENQAEQNSNCGRPQNNHKANCQQKELSSFSRTISILDIKQNVVLPHFLKETRFGCPQHYRKYYDRDSRDKEKCASLNIRKAPVPQEQNKNNRHQCCPGCDHIGTQKQNNRKTNPKQRHIEALITICSEESKTHIC